MQLQSGGLWVDIHARSFDLDGSKGLPSPFPEHTTIMEMHAIINGIADTWTNIVGKTINLTPLNASLPFCVCSC